MFGESLFGAWLDPAQYMAAGMNKRKKGSWGKRIGILVGAVAVVALGVYFTQLGFSKKAGLERAQMAHEVSAFLSDGELRRTQKYLDMLAPPALPLRPDDPHLDLILRAEATLYRYHDGGPARLARMGSHLTGDPGNPQRVLAYFTVASRAERLAARNTFDILLPQLPKDPELYAILATTLEARQDSKGARQAWERSAELAPLWLPHRYLHAWFEFRAGRVKDASRLVKGMLRVAPDSPWTLLAHRQFAPTEPIPVIPLEPGQVPAAPAPLPPVGVYYQHLQEALAKLSAKEPQAARSLLLKALDAVEGQGPFVLDAFDLLVEARAFDLALDVTSLETWPRGNPQAKARIVALETARAKAIEASAPPTPVVDSAPKAATGPETKVKAATKATKGKKDVRAKNKKKTPKAKKAAKRG
jgi:tetratricopeptide (TPR) repeat protein